MFSIIFSGFAVHLGATVLSYLFNICMVNMTVEVLGKLRVGNTVSVLEMNLEVQKSFHMIYKSKT